MLAVVRKELGPRDPDLEDVVNEACIGFFQCSQRQLIENWRALGKTIARRRAHSHITRLVLCKKWMSSSEFPPDLIDHRNLHAEWMVRLIFDDLERIESPCLTLLHRHGLRGEAWKELAREMNLSEVALRQRWSRCCEKIRLQYETLYRMLHEGRLEQHIGGRQ